MFSAKYDTMLIIVHVWRILEAPLRLIDCNRDDSVVLSCRMVNTSCIAFVLKCKADILDSRSASVYVLLQSPLDPSLGFEQIDCNIKIAIFRQSSTSYSCIHDSGGYNLNPDQLVEIFGCLLWAFLIFLPECLSYDGLGISAFISFVSNKSRYTTLSCVSPRLHASASSTSKISSNVDAVVSVGSSPSSSCMISNALIIYRNASHTQVWSCITHTKNERFDCLILSSSLPCLSRKSFSVK